jgi:hypothetical protein
MAEQAGHRLDEEVRPLEPLQPPRVDHHPPVEQPELPAHRSRRPRGVLLHVDTGGHHADTIAVGAVQLDQGLLLGGAHRHQAVGRPDEDALRLAAGRLVAGSEA